MKTASLLFIASTLLSGSVALGSASHDFDKGLESTLRATLNDRHVHVHVKQGIVSLDGRVPTETDRERVEAIVRRTDGVVAVKDNLQVTLPSPASVPVARVAPVTTVTVPVYTTAAPVIIAPSGALSSPAPLVLPDYPRVTVQAWSVGDEPAAERIAHELQRGGRPLTVIDNVNVTVQGGVVSLKGKVDTEADRQALLAATQRAGGIRAIYDQLRTRVR